MKFRKSFAFATVAATLSAFILAPVAGATVTGTDGTIRCLIKGYPAVRVQIPQLCPTESEPNVNPFSAFVDQGTIVSIEHWDDPYAEDFQASAKAPNEEKPGASKPEGTTDGATAESEEPSSAEDSSSSLRTQASYSLSDFESAGVVNWGGYKFTYYSESVLPGGGLAIPGRHVNEDGYVADADGYIVLASSSPNGTVFDTPFGYPGKVYDSGTSGNHLDVYIR